MLLKCGRSAVRSMVSVCSHSGANNIRSSVLVELDLEEEYQRVNGVGLQSQRGQQYQVERAGEVGLGGKMCRSAVTARGGQWCRSACWWSWTWRWANNIRSSVLVELDLEEEYQRVNGVGLQSQREAISAVVDERAGGANNIRSM